MSDEGLSRGEAYDLLSNERRRYVLEAFDGTEQPVPVQELAAYVAARENGTDAEATTDAERKRAYVSLYQNHVPRLAEVGVLDHDDAAGTVAPGDRFDDLDGYLLREDGAIRHAGDARPQRLALALLAVAFAAALAYLGDVHPLAAVALVSGVGGLSLGLTYGLPRPPGRARE